MREFDSEYCNVKYIKKDSAVLLTWKKFACFNDYRKPTMFALELLKEYENTNLIIDARNGFEDEKEDVDWAFSELLPSMAKTDCKIVCFIMEKQNKIEDEMNMWEKEFSKYFKVFKAESYQEAIEKRST